MKILFMGTPDFAVDTLRVLMDSRHEVIGVVTQPDRPKGRSGKMQYSPVKDVALEYGIEVYQPEKVRDETFIQELHRMAPDVIVVVAFGQILSKEILELPKYGCLNVHASLLPKFRGAAPIQWAVIDGEKESGVTIQQMEEGLDTGDILLVKKYTLEEKETGGSLFEKLAKLGGPMILEVLEAAEKGELHPVSQEEEKHTYAKKLSKSTGLIDFSKAAIEIERLIRGLNPWPSAYCYLEGKMLKVWEAEVVPADFSEEEYAVEYGTIVKVGQDHFLVRTADGLLKILSVQLAGKKRMDTAAFLRGYPLKEHTVLK